MRRTIPLAVLAALALPAAAPAGLRNSGPADPSIADGSAQRALDGARATWRAFDGRAHYRMSVSLSCFCTPDAAAPHRIEVRDGRPTRPSGMHRYATVGRLFARVQEAIDQRVAVLDVRYDRHGVPRELWVDVSQLIADEELGIHVTRFRALD